MFRRIYRQRRRLLVGAFFFTLGVVIMVMEGVTAGILEFYTPWIAGIAAVVFALIIMLCYILVGAVFLTLLPDWRTLIEMVGLIFFTMTALPLLFPIIYSVPYLDAALPFLLTLGLYGLVYGEVLNRFRLWVDHKSSKSFVSPKSAEALWAELVPGEGPINDHWDTMLYSLETDEDDPDSYYAQYTYGGSIYEHQTMTFLERDAPHFARYHHVGEVDPKNRSLVEGTYAVEITPLDKGGCRVKVTGTRTWLVHSAALLIWFDDYLGDQIDHLRAIHHKKSDWSLTGRVRRKIQKYA